MKTVLIIDDDPGFRTAMREILGAKGWRVLEASDGEAGLRLAQQYPNVVLCNLFMPHGNGFQLCRAIRADANLRDIKIVAISSRDYEADRVAAREAGADTYLTKPVRPEVIIKLMDELEGGLAATATASASTKPVGSSPVRLKFWGVRGSIPTPGAGTIHYGGNTSCVEVRAGGQIIILDAGTGLRALGHALVDEFKDQPLALTLLITHLHWDHIQGLPFFAPVYQPQCRLSILCFEGLYKSLLNVLSGKMGSNFFPVPFAELPCNIEIKEIKHLEFQIGPVRVAVRRANHPGVCVGYRLFTDDGSIAYFPDNELFPRRCMGTAVRPMEGRAARQYEPRDEETMIKFLTGTDVLILDTQYDREEYLRHIGWGHGCMDAAVEVALRAAVKQFFLFHHDPDHDDDKISAMVEHSRRMVAEHKGSLIVEAAREGLVVQLAPRSEHPANR